MPRWGGWGASGQSARDRVCWAGDGVGALSIDEIRPGSGTCHQPKARLAFVARSRAAVDAFHATALCVGGRSDRDPGVWPDDHPNHSAALVLDPDGNRIEAACQAPW